MNSKPEHRAMYLVLVFPILGYIAFAMFAMLLGVVLPGIIEDFSLTDLEAGLLLSAVAAATGGGMILGGYGSDRLGWRGIMISGLGLFAAGNLLTGLSQGYLMCLLFISIAGFGGGFFDSALYSVVGTAFADSRGLAVGVFNGFYGTGGFLGASLSGQMTVMYGWRSVFNLLAAIGVLFTIGQILFFKPPRIRKPDSVNATTNGTRSATRSAFTRNLLIAVSAIAIHEYSFASVIAWTPIFLVRVDLLSLPNAGMMLAVFGVFGALGAILLGTLSDRLGRRLMITFSGIGSGSICILLYASVHTFPTLMLLVAVLGFFGYAAWSLLISAAQDSVDRAAVGTATGLAQSSGLIGGIPAPAVTAALISIWKIPGALLVTASIPCFLYGLLILTFDEPSASSSKDETP